MSDNDQQFELKHVIGADSDVNGGLCLLNENTIVYPAANQIVLQDTLDNSQQFIHTGGSVTAISASHATNLLAVAEKGDVKLYDASTLHSKRTLATEATNDIIDISLSRDAKKCLTLGGSPDYVLTMWDVDRSTVFASLKLSTVTKKDLSSISMSLDCSQICVIGEKVIRLFNLSNTTKRFQAVKATDLSIPPNYTAQLFLVNGDLVIASDSGSLLVMGDDVETKQLLKIDHPVTSLASCPKGFVVGCGSEGNLVIFQQINKDCSYAVKRTIHTQHNTPIRSMVVTRMKECSQSVICLTDSRSIVKVPLTDNDRDANEIELVPSLNLSVRRSDIDNLIPDAGTLLVDSCVWEPLIAIGGYDGLIRLFNYHTRQVVLSQKFDEKISSLSFHSSGQYLLVSSPTTVSLNAVLMDKLDTLWQVESSPKQPPASTCFSKGSLFAISLGGTTTIQIHDIQSSFEIVSTLRGGHTKAIIETSFNGHKDELISVGADGVVCLWDINRCVTKTRTVDFSSPAFLSAVITHDCSHVFAISADGQLKAIDVVKGELVAQAKVDASARLMTTLEDGKVVVSTTDGGVECISLTESSSSITRQGCFDSSQSRVSSIHQCASSGLLVSASRDGFVSIYKGGGTEEQSSSYRPLDGVSVISSVDHEKQMDIEKELKTKIVNLELKHKATVESAQADHEANKATLKDELEMKRDRLKYEINELRDENDAQEKQHEDQLDALMTEYQRNMSSVRQDYEKKLAIEKDNTDKLSKSMEERKLEHASQLAELDTSHSELISKETIALSEMLVAENEKNEQLLSDIKSLKQHANDQQKALEDDAEKEMSDLATKHSSALKSLKEKNSLLNTDKSILKQRHYTQREDLKELHFQVSFQEDKVQASEETVSTLDGTIESNSAAIDELDKSILQKESELCLINSKNMNEEHNNKSLLQATSDLKNALQEEEVKVQEQARALKQKKKELNQATITSTKSRNDLSTMTMKLKQLQTSCTNTQTILVEKKQLIDELEKGIANARVHSDDNKLLKASVVTLSNKFLHGTDIKKTESSSSEKLVVMEKKIDALRSAIRRKSQTHETEMSRLKREQISLEKVSVALDRRCLMMCFIRTSLLCLPPNASHTSLRSFRMTTNKRKSTPQWRQAALYLIAS